MGIFDLPNPASTFGFNFDAFGNMVGAPDNRNKHISGDFASELQGIAQEYLKQLSDLGIRFTPGSIHGGYDRGTGFIAYGEDLNDDARKYQRSFSPDDIGAGRDFIARSLVRRADLGSIENQALKEGLQNLDVTGLSAQDVFSVVNKFVNPGTGLGDEIFATATPLPLTGGSVLPNVVGTPATGVATQNVQANRVPITGGGSVGDIVSNPIRGKAVALIS